MTPAQLRELCDREVTVPFLTALEAIGLGETAGRKAYARGELPTRVIRIGRALRVPTVDLARLLLIPDMDETAAATAVHVTTNETDEVPHGQGDTPSLRSA